ncbi:hypothetical protein DCO58_05680 [Helicobacter saguini]|uniref:Uncharacterized protein n=1 Tax=Helicobacter saguini TaxID=1548018 RepID=A0A6B0HSQ0_9HELI|nr:hypothetical protein [Helicobacter saguini]MWV62162.1 hypothetical protein [Helicobacter saguini]MWV67165.1 hypothetical protein [Helicobacter saguini]MWV69517.1 hypothetical protein [Helicobacter saguini]MWV70932.1 hypothetical protein [Helicobacter saguini]
MKNRLNDGLKYLWNLKDDFAFSFANLHNNFFGYSWYNALYKNTGK